MSIHPFDSDPHAEWLQTGQSVFQAGESGEVMYAVLDGAVDLVVRGQLVETVGAGGVFGEMALIDNQPRTAAAIVKTAARLVLISRKRFLFLVQQNPYFSLLLMSVMARRLRRMDEGLRAPAAARWPE